MRSMRLSAMTFCMARPSAAALTRNPSLVRARDEIADFAMVVDDKDMQARLHFCNIDELSFCALIYICPILPSVASDKLCHNKPYC